MRTLIGTLTILTLAANSLSAQGPAPAPPPPLPVAYDGPPAAPTAGVYQPPPTTVTTVYQPPPVPPAPYPPSEGIAPPIGAPLSAPPPTIFLPMDPGPYRVWARAELLLWWVKNTPVPAPIGTVTDALGNTQTVIGQQNTSFGAFTGGRFVVGAWFDPDNRFGFESSIFWLDGRRHTDSANSFGSGSPTVGLSFLNATPGSGGGEFIQPLSSPGAFAGGVEVSSTLDLWGADVNGAFSLVRSGPWEVIGLAGFKYLDLRENLSINSNSTDLTTGDFVNLYDQFSTRNQFYGGQLGARVSWQTGRLALDGALLVALGATHQSVDIQGSSFSTAAGGSFPGGFYAQPSNIGHYTANQFGVVPTLQLKVNYQLTRWTRLFLGYDFMYWNQVVRPGSQMDRNINLVQSPILNPGAVGGPALPMPLFNRSDFWAQGLTLGLEFRF